MKKPLLFLVIIFAITNLAVAQTKTAEKSDSINTKVPLNLQNEKLAKSDSLYLKQLTAQSKAQTIEADNAELRFTSCDFEKDANAMVLFDVSIMAIGSQNILIVRNKRIKIFNDNGKSEANIKIELNNRFGVERLLGIEGRTINLNNGKIEYTKLDQKLIYSQRTDKDKNEIIFSFPNVKSGSVIEYEYAWSRDFSRSFPEWDFQSNLPVGYSEVNIFLNPFLHVDALFKKHQPFIRDTAITGGFGHVWAMANVPSSRTEPFMRSAPDALQSITLLLKSANVDGKTQDVSGSWAIVGKQVVDDKLFSKPFEQSFTGENDLVKTAKKMATNDEKIAFLFNQVKTGMKWNEEKNWLSKDGIKSAWKKKNGNWGEINMILCQLLKQAGIKAYPMLVSTRDNGLLRADFANIYQINKLVTYIPVDGTKYYVLDATDKYNTYNEIPFDLLNSDGLYLNKDAEKYELVSLKRDLPVKQVVLINAEIKSNGTMSGTTQINSFSYHKAANLELYKKLDEKKYKDYLTGNDNNIKITSLKFENADIDTLPLTQNLDFNLDLQGTDDKYIYFNPNLFTSLHTNPFISETRYSDIDFGCRFIYSINGRYKIPQGYKVDALPKSLTLLMPDKSISFKRVVVEQDGDIIVYYVIDYKKSIYKSADYSALYEYFKKMDEMLNEQIVLKKDG